MTFDEYSAVEPFFKLPFHPKTAKCSWRFIKTVIKDFFFLQTAQKLHLKNYPVIHVDTELDELIPFEPEYVNIYMDFINFFVKSIDLLIKELGYKKAIPYINSYVDFLTKIYKNAAQIYRFCMTTTTRPKCKKKKFITIRIFDPHLLCVPSIHVSIASGTYAWFKKFFSEDLIPNAEAENLLNQIKEKSISIIESVLYIKQHSVNCVPLGLYLITATNENSFFPTSDAINFIEALFKNSNDISEDNKSIIIDYINYMYERALLESIYHDNWKLCIINWLISYAKETGQTI